MTDPAQAEGGSEAGEDAVTSTGTYTQSFQSSYATAQSVMTPVAESPLPGPRVVGDGDEGDENLGAAANAPSATDEGPAGPPRGGKWRRRATPTAREKQAGDRDAYLAEMRAYFDEVSWPVCWLVDVEACGWLGCSGRACG